MLCDNVLIENNKYGCVIIQIIEQITSYMRKWLKPGFLSTVCERWVRG